MIQPGSLVKITDNSGVIMGQCIKVLGHSRKGATYGDLILISVRTINKRKFANAKERLRKRFQYGTLHRALVVRTREIFRRANNTAVRYNENSVVLVNARGVPIATRVHGPILTEFAMIWPSLGCIIRTFI
jgi:large subunit ribosomal protein L14